MIGCKQAQGGRGWQEAVRSVDRYPLTHEACDQLTVVPKTGELNEAQFDEKVKNLVTFLAYSANPNKLASERIGTLCPALPGLLLRIRLSPSSASTGRTCTNPHVGLRSAPLRGAARLHLPQVDLRGGLHGFNQQADLLFRPRRSLLPSHPPGPGREERGGRGDRYRAGRCPPMLAEVNPYGSVPTLVDRDLALYEPTVVIGIPRRTLSASAAAARLSGEACQQPPVDPSYPAGLVFPGGPDPGCAQQGGRVVQARRELRESLTGVSPLFADKAYFLSEDFSLVDCCLLPILWRLPLLGIELPRQADRCSTTWSVDSPGKASGPACLPLNEICVKEHEDEFQPSLFWSARSMNGSSTTIARHISW